MTPENRRRLQAPGSIRFARAEGEHIWDADGRRYLDLTSGWNVVNAGWNNSDIRCSWLGLATRLPFRPSWCTDDASAELQQMFGELLPGYALIPGCSGAEGIDNALKVARLVTGYPGVISFENSYHGSATGAALAAGYDLQHIDMLGLPELTVRLPVKPGVANLKTVEHLVRGAEGAGAIVIETVLTNAGCAQAPAALLQLLRALATELGLLLICDEIGTGVYRTGPLFSFQSCAIRPDIVVCGKAITNGFYPLSLCLVSENLMRGLDRRPFDSTYAGTPSACAAAIATLRHLASHELGARALSVSDEIRAYAKKLSLKVHGRGFELAIELEEKDASAKQPLVERLLRKGVFAATSPGDTHVMVTPPLMIELAPLRDAIDTIAEVLGG
ncbi:MAG: aminotransferase class III-fold pyridoxal phosphate-dependent enzyme [Vitreimonas sp.]